MTSRLGSPDLACRVGRVLAVLSLVAVVLYVIGEEITATAVTAVQPASVSVWTKDHAANHASEARP